MKNDNTPEKPQKRKNTEGSRRTAKPVSAVEKTTWQVNGQGVSVDIHREHRRSWRYSFGKNARLIVRIPKLSKADDVQLLTVIQAAFAERTAAKPALLQHFDPRKYADGETLTVGNRQYLLKISVENRATNAAKLLSKSHVIDLKLSVENTEGSKLDRKSVV